MPKTNVIFYQDKNGKCPVLDWLSELPKKVQAKADVRIERLAELGYELRRPEADLLRDGIYELRWRFQTVNFRILYFFYGKNAVVLTHGLTKETEVPAEEIDAALTRKNAFERNPELHTHTEG